mmetsp:Transcript_94094/g.155540  ORF Transcript_94094/g.155540 Transcript_94094/m.155540 type:complete len:87 (-) Transcript_94094:236-496(-)
MCGSTWKQHTLERMSKSGRSCSSSPKGSSSSSDSCNREHSNMQITGVEILVVKVGLQIGVMNKKTISTAQRRCFAVFGVRTLVVSA